jgi:hypothetical protein
MATKLNDRYVRKEFQNKGWRLMSLYETSAKPMSVICPSGHETTISWNNFQRGQGCKFCAQNVHFTYDFVRNYFSEHGCELLDKNYVNSVTPLNYRCLCGTISKIDFGNFRKGRRCQTCKSKKSSQENRTKHDDIETLCKQHDCQLVRSWITNRKTRIEYICKCGESSEAYLTNFKRFPNCKKCDSAKISGDKCHMFNPDREAVALSKRFRKMCGQHILRFMKATAQKKTKSTHTLLGYTPQELQKHILNHPDYATCIGKEWHVDHIFPIQAFLDHGILDLKIINKLDNLRPMLGPENLLKADKYNETEFKKWLEANHD